MFSEHSELKQEMDLLNENLERSRKDLEMHYQRSQDTKIRITNIGQEVEKIRGYTRDLDHAIHSRNDNNFSQASVISYEFFIKLHKEHLHILELLNTKIKETESLADIVFKQKPN